MKDFEEYKKQRWEKGAKEYGEDAWKEQSVDELITEVEQEIIDCANYLEMLKQKGVDATHLNGNLKYMYNEIQNYRQNG